VLCAVFPLVFIFLFYGPFEAFRLLWINTAMYSSRFQFLAHLFYTEKYIAQVLARNEPSEDRKTDDSALTVKWGDGVFFTKIHENNYKGYIIRIDDPTRVLFVQSAEKKGTLLEQLTKKHKGLGGINASGYTNPQQMGIPWGITIADGRIVSDFSRSERHIMGGFNANHKLVVGTFTREAIEAQKYLWAFEFGPLLIVNGEKTEFTAFSGGLAPRTAIGQTAEGHVLLLVVDGRQITSIGATYQNVQNILYEYGAINAINLDGGSSATMVYRGRVVNNPPDGDKERLLPNAIIFK